MDESRLPVTEEELHTAICVWLALMPASALRQLVRSVDKDKRTVDPDRIVRDARHAVATQIVAKFSQARWVAVRPPVRGPVDLSRPA